MQKPVLFAFFMAFLNFSFAQNYINNGLELTYLGTDANGISGSKIRLGYGNLKNFGIAAILTNAKSGNIAVTGLGPELYYQRSIWKNLNFNIVGSALIRSYSGGSIIKGDGLRWSAGLNVLYPLRILKGLMVKPIIGYTYQNTSSSITYTNNIKGENSIGLGYLNYGAALSYSIKRFSFGLIPMFLNYKENNDFGLSIGAGYFF